MSISKAERDELEAQYDTLTKRISAINSDLSVTLDSEQKYALQQRAAAASKERDAIAVQLNKPRVNGDLDKLRSKVDELASAIEDGNPGKTHKVISECYTILVGLDDRVTGVEMRVDLIESPPLSVIFWRSIAFIMFIIGVAIFAIPYFNYIFFSRLGVGVFMETLILALAVVFWWVAHITLVGERQRIDPRRGRNAR